MNENEFDRQLSKARRRAFFAELRHAWWGNLIAAVLVVAVLGAFALGSSPPRFRGFVFGRWVGEFITPSKTFPQTLLVTVKLENGGALSLTLPKGTMARPGGRMKIAIYERGFGPLHQEMAKFDSYVEPASGN